MPKSIQRLSPIILMLLAACSWSNLANEFSPEPSTGNEDSTSAAIQPLTSEQAETLGVELIIQANSARSEANNRPLIAHAALAGAAEQRTGEMAQLGYFDHIHPLRGTAEIERLLRPRIPEGRIAELLYLNDCSAQELAELAVQAWLEDPANRRVLLDPSFNLVGAGAARGAAGLYAALILTEEG